MSKPVRVGLIGCSEVAERFLLPALVIIPGVHLWSIFSRDWRRAAPLGYKYHAQRTDQASRNLESFLADPCLDAVIIASQDGLHAEQALTALAAGKHVFVEKPLALSVGDAEAIEQAAHACQLSCAVGYHLRWHAGHRALKERVVAGDLGAIQHFSASWAYPIDRGNWRNRTSLGRWWSLGALGTHCLDLASYFIQEKVVALTCVTSNVNFNGRDESAVVDLVFEGGATAHIEVSVVSRSKNCFSIVGEKGSAAGERTFGPHGSGSIFLNNEPLSFVQVDPYAAELAGFVRSVQDGTLPQVGADIGVENVRLLEWAEASAQKGR